MNYHAVKDYAESLRKRGVPEFSLMLPDGSAAQMKCGEVTAVALAVAMELECAPYDPESDDFAIHTPSLQLDVFKGLV